MEKVKTDSEEITNQIPEEQLMIKISVEQLQECDIKVIVETLVIKDEFDATMTMMGYTEEEGRQIQQRYQEIKEREQQNRLTKELPTIKENTKRKREENDEENDKSKTIVEKGEDSKRSNIETGITEMSNLLKEQIKQNNQIIDLMQDLVKTSKESKRSLNYLYTDKADKKRRRLVEDQEILKKQEEKGRKKKILTPMQIRYQEKRKAQKREEESLKERMKKLEEMGYFNKNRTKYE